MNISLIHPAGSNWMPGKKDVSATANRMAPLGLLSMAAYLEERGHRVQVVDCLGPKPPKDAAECAGLVLAARPGLVGLSATTSGFLDGYAIAAAIKARQADIPIVFGGVHVSALGARLLEEFPLIDYLCLGEGEQTLYELAEGHAAAGIHGLVWREGETLRTNLPRKHLADLDSLPYPAYE